MSEQEARYKELVADVEFIEDPKTRILRGRAKTRKGKDFFMNGDTVKPEFDIAASGVSQAAIFSAIEKAVDAELVVHVRAGNGKCGIVARDADGELAVKPSARHCFRSNAPELLAAAEAFDKSKPKTRSFSPEEVDPSGVISGFDGKVELLRRAFLYGGQLYLLIITLLLREILSLYPDGLPKHTAPMVNAEPIVAPVIDDDGKRWVETVHPAFSEPGTVRAALLLAEAELKESGEWNPEIVMPSIHAPEPE